LESVRQFLFSCSSLGLIDECSSIWLSLVDVDVLANFIRDPCVGFIMKFDGSGCSDIVGPLPGSGSFGYDVKNCPWNFIFSVLNSCSNSSVVLAI